MIDAALTEGATLIAVRIDDRPDVGATDRDPRDRFMRGLGVRQTVQRRLTPPLPRSP